jgi:hypothetical protein
MKERKLKMGDLCRARCGAPARSLGNGRCLFIPVLDSKMLQEDEERPPDGTELDFPLPLMKELEAWPERVAVEG